MVYDAGAGNADLLMPILSLKADAEEQQQDEHAMEWW